MSPPRFWDHFVLHLEGEVERPTQFTTHMLTGLPARWHVPEVGQLDPRRRGQAVWLAGLLDTVGVRPQACYLTLHASRDDFHASVPLEAVRERALVIFELDGQPLPPEQGGPFRFLVLDAAACKTAELDECVNVKYVDRLELSVEPGRDNRPKDDRAHAALHSQDEAREF